MSSSLFSKSPARLFQRKDKREKNRQLFAVAKSIFHIAIRSKMCYNETKKGGERMRKITKRECVALIKEYDKSKPFFPLFLSAIIITALWLSEQIIAVAATITVLLVFWSAFTLLRSHQNVKNTDEKGFYLAEDVVVAYKKRRRTGKASGSGYDHIFTFRDHGSYTIHKSVYPTTEIPLQPKPFDRYDVEDRCLTFCDPGDAYYLLILEEKKGVKILQCFPKYSFEPYLEDFTLTDGKYRPNP